MKELQNKKFEFLLTKGRYISGLLYFRFMNNGLYSWGHHRRFNAYSNYFQSRFGTRMQKLSVDAGFTCPNRDGSKGTGGCTFCSNDAFNPSYCLPEKSVTQQLNEGIEFHRWRYKKAAQYLAYFQAYSNTYASIDKLKVIYNEALNVDGIAGLVIGTRPDCITDELLDYFTELGQHYFIAVEYGIESCYDKTLLNVNRGHDFATTVEAIQRTVERGLFTGGHLIFGLPGESKEEMLAEAHILSTLPLHSIKFHQLQVFKNTTMEMQYKEHPEIFRFFEFEEYCDFIVDFLEQLRPDIIVERFAGEVPPRFQAGPGWGLIRNEKIVSLIEKRLQERNTWQGKHFTQNLL